MALDKLQKVNCHFYSKIKKPFTSCFRKEESLLLIDIEKPESRL